jgi:type I restriction enzyme S subunit
VPKIDQSGPPKTGEFTYIDISSIDNELKRVVELKRVPVSAAPSRAKQRLQPGDVLVSMTRPNLNAVAIVSPDLKGAIGSTGFHVLRAVAGIEPRWLFYGVQTHAFVEAMSSLVQGALYPAVRPKDIKGFGLDAPSWSEQQRIVAEIEKQFSRLDEAVANLKRVKADLKRYKAAVLKAAVEGKLTEDWRKQHPHVEPASKLLKHFLAERRANWGGKGKYKEPVISSSANLLPLPPGWCWATLDQTLWQLRSGTAETSKREPTEYPVLKSSAVRQRTIDFSSLNYLQKSQSMRPENFLKLGDFLITRLSGSVDYVGCSAVVKSSSCEGIQYPDRIFCGKLLTGVDGTYLSYCFQHPRIRKTLEGAAKSTAGHQRISMSDLYPLTLPLPPTAEQVRIVAEVERRLSVIEEVEVAVEANLTRADRLRQSILATAFAGKLVITNPSRMMRGGTDIKMTRSLQ